MDNPAEELELLEYLCSDDHDEVLRYCSEHAYLSVDYIMALAILYQATNTIHILTSYVDLEYIAGRLNVDGVEFLSNIKHC